MYVMVNKDNHKCPKCKSTALIHFVDDNNKPTIKRDKVLGYPIVISAFSIASLDMLDLNQNLIFRILLL